MMKTSTPPLGRISLLFAILVWLALLLVDLVRIFGTINNLDSGISEEVTWILEILFSIFVYLVYRHNFWKNRHSDFLTLIWRGTSTGLLAASAGLLTELIYLAFGDSKIGTDPFLKNVFYHINFAWTSAFLISTTLLWKHLILYQKNKQVVNQWQAFELSMLVALFFVFYNHNNFDYSFLFGLVILLVISILLAVNLKWIPYLNFKEKWKTLLFLFLIMLCAGVLFYRVLDSGNEGQLQINLTDNLFLIALFGFVFTYGLFSFLVTLFNLPTSSVFEQKLTEAINFQKLSQSIQPEESEEQVLDILLDSCISASFSDGAWIELNPKELFQVKNLLRFLDEPTQAMLTSLIPQEKQSWVHTSPADLPQPQTIRLSHANYKSALLVPLLINKSILARVVLIKEVKEGFNKEMISIIGTFARQACISVENHRLLNQAIENERYQEELKIAQRVQKALLPLHLDHPTSFDICAYSNTADEVGGDYYDTYQVDENHFVFIMGDVSGKGTSAAFHMAQMKGVFQSLIQLGLHPAEFMKKANSALSKCLERNHFITASIFEIDITHHTFCHARAGHIPTLWYKASEKTAEFISVEGLGLGIVRNLTYENHVQEKTFDYNSGDILVLLTDGILEGRKETGEQFGYERIKKIVEDHHKKSPVNLQQVVLDSLHQFVGGDGMIDDDYSLLVVKFK
ncbi:MAG: SpoIIE family protein phosphatase [Bacteroidetes bacterium]|nr:SpoIIE family protein phosphatase [Bacteroidota bacterium]